MFTNNGFVFTGSRTEERYPDPSPQTGILLATNENFDSLYFEEFLPEFPCVGQRILKLPGDSLLVCGYHLVSVENDPGWYLNGFAAKFDPEWNPIWYREFVPEESFSNFVYDAILWDQGNIIISTTWSGYGAWLVVMNSNSEIIGQIIDDGLSYATLHKLIVTQHGDIYAVGSTREDFFADENFIWLVRIADPDHVRHPDDSKTPVRFTLLSPYPNPFNSSFIIPFHLDFQGDVNIKLFDAAGRECFDVSKNMATPGNHLFTVDSHQIMNGLPGGLYFVNVRSGGKSLTKTITHLK